MNDCSDPGEPHATTSGLSVAVLFTHTDTLRGSIELGQRGRARAHRVRVGTGLLGRGCRLVAEQRSRLAEHGLRVIRAVLGRARRVGHDRAGQFGQPVVDARLVGDHGGGVGSPGPGRSSRRGGEAGPAPQLFLASTENVAALPPARPVITRLVLVPALASDWPTLPPVSSRTTSSGQRRPAGAGRGPGERGLVGAGLDRDAADRAGDGAGGRLDHVRVERLARPDPPGRMRPSTCAAGYPAAS